MWPSCYSSTRELRQVSRKKHRQRTHPRPTVDVVLVLLERKNRHSPPERLLVHFFAAPSVSYFEDLGGDCVSYHHHHLSNTTSSTASSIITMRLSSFALSFLAVSPGAGGGVGLASGQQLRSSTSSVGTSLIENNNKPFMVSHALERQLTPVVGTCECNANDASDDTCVFDGVKTLLEDNFDAETDKEDDFPGAPNWESSTGQLRGPKPPGTKNNNCGSESGKLAVRFATGNTDREIVSAPFTIPAGETGTLSFYIKYGTAGENTCNSPGGGNKVKLQYSTSATAADDTAWVDVGSLFSTLYTDFTLITKSLPDDAKRFRVVQENGAGDWAVDTFKLTVPCTCVNQNKIVLEDNFDDGTEDDNPDTRPSWEFSTGELRGPGGSNQQTCGSQDGAAFAVRFANSNAGVRQIVSAPFTIPAGEDGALSFYLKYGTGVGFCKEPAVDSSVKLQYSTSATAGDDTAWVDIADSPYPTASFKDFTLIEETLPDDAKRFRLIQTAGADHWAIDTVKLTVPAVPETACPDEDVELTTSFIDEDAGLVVISSNVAGSICSWSGGTLDDSCKGCSHCVGQVVAVPTEDFQVCVSVPACEGYTQEVCTTVAAISAMPSSYPSSTTPSIFPSSMPSLEPSLLVCADAPNAACKFEFDSDGGPFSGSYTAICLASCPGSKKGDCDESELEFENKCVNNDDLEGLVAGDDLDDYGTIVNCGCCVNPTDEHDECVLDRLDCTNTDPCNKEGKSDDEGQEVKFLYCAPKKSGKKFQNKCEKAFKYELESGATCGTCAVPI